MSVLENQIRLQYKLFSHENYWTQLHAQDPKENKLVSRTLVQGVGQVIEWATEYDGKANLYIGRAARDRAGIPIRTSVFTLDADPVRPKNSASSAEQHRRIIQWGRGVCKGLGNAYLCSSGNGVLLIVPFDRPIEAGLLDFSEKAKQFELQLRETFATEEINVDATQDAARLCRLLGTRNVKGDRQLWRVAHVVSRPLFRTKQSRVRELIERIQVSFPVGTSVESGGQKPLENRAVPVHVGPLPTYDHSIYPTREKAEFALALRLKLAGLGAEDIRQQLASYGYIQNPRDAERIVNKLFGREAPVQRSNGVGGLPAHLSVQPEPLWTPKDGLRSREGSGGGLQSLGTGFKFLDDTLGGFKAGSVYAIEAPTNVGKSTFITQVAAHLARRERRVLLVITEMDEREAAQRIAALSTGLRSASLDANKLSGQEQMALDVFNRDFAKTKLFVRYTTSPCQAAIEKDIQASQAEIVLWDYYQHFETGNESRQVQLGSLARWFESSALKYQIPFVVAAQLHRRKDFKNNKLMAASMDDIKDCKVLNDASKVVVVLDWDHGADVNGDGPIPVHFRIEKNKGPQGNGLVRLNRQIPRFEEL
jgi:hypothetical protein